MKQKLLILLKVEHICIDCSKPFFTDDEDACLCDKCLKKYLVDYYKQLSYIVKIEND